MREKRCFSVKKTLVRSEMTLATPALPIHSTSSTVKRTMTEKVPIRHSFDYVREQAQLACRGDRRTRVGSGQPQHSPPASSYFGGMSTGSAMTRLPPQTQALLGSCVTVCSWPWSRTRFLKKGCSSIGVDSSSSSELELKKGDRRDWW